MPAFGSIASASTENETTLTVTKPTDLAEGDLMVFFGLHTTGGSGGAAFTRSGWEEVDSIADGSPIGGYLTILAKVADSGDAAASDFAFTNSGAGSTTISGVLYRITGTFTSHLNIVASTAEIGAETADDEPRFATGITPQANSLLIMYTGARVTNSSTSAVSGYLIENDNPTWTERADIAVSTEEDQRVGTATATRTEATATGYFQSDFNSTGNAVDDGHRGALIAIQDSANNTFNATPLIITNTQPDPAVTGDANVTATPLVINATQPDATYEEEDGKWTNKNKSSASNVVNLDKS